jgi:hypothetical protein
MTCMNTHEQQVQANDVISVADDVSDLNELEVQIAMRSDLTCARRNY